MSRTDFVKHETWSALEELNLLAKSSNYSGKLLRFWDISCWREPWGGGLDTLFSCSIPFV